MRRRLVVLLAMAMVIVAVAVVPSAVAKPTPESITVLGIFPSGSPDTVAFEAELAAFSTENRVEIIYESYFDPAELVDRVTGSDRPDLIVVPQPGTLVDLAPELVDLGEFVNPRSLRRDFGDYMIDLASVDDAVLGAPIRADLKSLVWYKPATFEAYGYSVPESFAELVALSDTMVADGAYPWCNYIESGFATGWMGTDWVEDLLLSAEGPAVYDAWVDHGVVFQDPRVEAAFERYQQMVDTPGYVFDRGNMTSVFFGFNAEALGAGECMMHKQAGFFAAFFPGAGYDLGDFSTFKFPAVNPDFADSAVGGGVYLAALNERAEVRQLVRFLLSQRFGREALTEPGGWILPNVRFDLKQYGDELTRSFAEIVQAAIEAGQFRFDGSDLMPPVVGSGEFWFAIRDLVDGVRFLPGILTDIDAAWPN